MKFYKILSITVLFAAVASSSFAQFIDVTPETYDKIWSIGQNYKTDRKLESPINYGVELRSGVGGAAVLITPATITKYISYSKDDRLIFPDESFKKAILNSNNYVYIATYALHLKTPLAGTVMPQLPSQRLLIEKDNQYIIPVAMNTKIYDMMPHSYALVYYAIPKQIIMNPPYTIKFINGNGDKIEIPINADKLAELMDKENKLVYKTND